MAYNTSTAVVEQAMENILPSKDSAANVNVGDVIGNKTDELSGDSIKADTHVIREHLHSQGKVVPSGADPTTLTTAAAGWTEGAKVQFIASAAEPMDFHWAQISDIDAVGYFELYIYSGGIGAEVLESTVPFFRTNNFIAEGNMPVQMDPVPAGTRISASIASSTGNADSCKIKFPYHEY